MARSRHPGFLNFEKAEIWRVWKSGKTLNSIGRALDRAGPHVRDLVVASGGIAPPPRRRSSWVLSSTEREEISRGIAAGHSMRTIATAFERTPSTVSREIALQLNQRPRKALGFRCPAGKFGECVALTA